MQQQQQQQLAATVNVGPPPAYEPLPQAPAPWLVTTPRPPTTVSHYRQRQSIYLGVTLIVVGLLSIGFNIVDVCISKHIAMAHADITDYYNYYYGDDYYNFLSLGYVGHGFWSGIMSVLAGTFAVGAGRKRTLSQIRTSLVLCIVAASFLLAQFGVSLAGAITVGLVYVGGGENCCVGSCSYYDHYYYASHSLSPGFCRETETLTAMESLLALLSVIGGITAICVSVFGCKAACCCNCCGCCKQPNSAQSATVYPHNMMQNGIPIALASTQQQQQQQQQQLGGAPNMIPVSYPIQHPVDPCAPPRYQFAAAAPMYYPPPATDLLATQQTQRDDIRKSPL